MIILTCALNYDESGVRPFMQSLQATGYSGQVACICNDSPARGYLKNLGVHILEDNNNGFHVNSRRFFIWKEFLRGVNEPVIISDIRDVIFQSNPEYNMPIKDINVFSEDLSMTIGSCPYNSKWMRDIFSKPMYSNHPIICAGITSGYLTEYCHTVWDMLKDLPPIVGLDQAIHNHIVYSNRLPCHIHTNDIPVFTVGYIRPLGNVDIKDGIVVSPEGTPCMVHQYDRHPNLKGGVKWQ